MRFVVIGAQGMLGSDVVNALQNRSALALGRQDLDITDLAAVQNAIEPDDVIVNCAAYTQVDLAESNETAAYAINALGAHHLAIAAAAVGAKLVTISTDYVFRGDGDSPYLESEQRAAISAYGRSKAAGEQLVMTAHPTGSYIVRTAWLYGKNGPNFAQTMLNLAQSQTTWSVVDDQRGQPTWTSDLAEQIIKLIDANAPAGIYHGTNSGEASWFEFAQAVLEEAHLDPTRIHPADSASFVRPAPRPAYSVLGHGRWAAIGLRPMRHWREALHAAFEAGTFNY